MPAAPSEHRTPAASSGRAPIAEPRSTLRDEAQRTSTGPVVGWRRASLPRTVYSPLVESREAGMRARSTHQRTPQRGRLGRWSPAWPRQVAAWLFAAGIEFFPKSVERAAATRECLRRETRLL